MTSHSTRIEGSTLTFEECIELILNGNTPGGKHITFSHQTLDHYQALNFVIEQADNNRMISKEFIQKIAVQVMKNTGEIFSNINGVVDASKGEFRKTGVRAGSVSFMHYDKVIPSLEKLCKELNEKFSQQKDVFSQLELPYYTHYQLVNTHPFLDGNGRTARLLMNFIQRRYQLPLEIVFSEDKALYYKALNSVREMENFDIYYDFMSTQYQKFLQIKIDQ